MNQALNALAKVLVPVRLKLLRLPKLKDPADEMVLETAVNGGADRLVTFNVRHLAAAAAEFGIRVTRPREAWKECRPDEAK